jgi:hypothetical protein
MIRNRILRLNKYFTPCQTLENDETYRNGIFVFNISKIIEHLATGQLVAELEDICVTDWYKKHITSNSLNEDHLKTVKLEKPVIQGEISPGNYNLIDGNHRLEKAHRENVEYVKSYKLKGEQLIDYFIDLKGYQSFVSYWNSKIQDQLDQ